MQRADVAIVDDDQSWVQSVAQLLGDAGLTVRAASDGEQALDLLATEQPALVILDVHLPRINGLELLRQFRQQASIQDRAMSAGATAFLRKPISVALLMRAVRRYLGDRGVPERGR